LSLVLVFVGAKMLVAGVYKVPILVSLGVIVALLGGSVLASLLRKPPEKSEDEVPEPAAEPPADVAPESVVAPPSVARTSIVCGTDFSAGASAAADAAAAIAKRLDLRLELVHVASSPQIDAESRLRARTEELQARHGVPVVPRVELGSAAETLVAVAARLDARLLVVSSLGAAKEHRWLLGSVAEQVARSSSIPVLVVREGSHIEAWAKGERPLRVMVGVDLSPVSRAALKWACKLDEIGPVELTVAQIAWPAAERQRAGSGGGVSSEALIEEHVQELTRSLEKWASGPLKSRQGSCVVQPGWGRVDSHLTQLAAASEVDLLVVGTHQRAGLARIREGSISSGVLGGAAMNVAAVPSAPRA
jgi:nucleotide-binding universal stress UspA family protein